ncbi:MAG TPA: hypothetical protein VFW00_03660 [Rhodocyclaceae bacterium]|nr:hypothetical protein [Rhodocyclaceae bacterium]
MNIAKKFAPLVLTALLAACASADFYPYESRNSDNVQIGKGGTRFVVDGIDVWFNGEPPHKYAILGYIEDHYSNGVDEEHKTIAPDVLKKAKEIGANGLIETAVSTPTTNSEIAAGSMFGGRHGGFGLGLGFGYPIAEQVTVKYTAVKYLD